MGSEVNRSSARHTGPHRPRAQACFVFQVEPWRAPRMGARSRSSRPCTSWCTVEPNGHAHPKPVQTGHVLSPSSCSTWNRGWRRNAYEQLSSARRTDAVGPPRCSTAHGGGPGMSTEAGRRGRPHVFLFHVEPWRAYARAAHPSRACVRTFAPHHHGTDMRASPSLIPSTRLFPFHVEPAGQFACAQPWCSGVRTFVPQHHAMGAGAPIPHHAPLPVPCGAPAHVPPAHHVHAFAHHRDGHERTPAVHHDCPRRLLFHVERPGARASHGSTASAVERSRLLLRRGQRWCRA
ncbi:hypothetical protein MYMAC_007197 [Corallococcus macrosporus DSM 14697]|uniref:Uncharacterized protein n=1 Tax=Corallococcus macrosporus DSM 14697 TaxID=1189310 RepID=A0A286SGQ2_9BACT|nr:hypothetical protein MYMAC_007197 [Corallococcus macrosporus DSM 14697]